MQGVFGQMNNSPTKVTIFRCKLSMHELEQPVQKEKKKKRRESKRNYLKPQNEFVCMAVGMNFLCLAELQIRKQHQLKTMNPTAFSFCL